MLCHFLDLKTGRPTLNNSNEIISAINQDGLDDELRYVYNDLHNPELKAARRGDGNVDPNDRPEFRNSGPEQQDCYGADARAELMAEAFRACLLNPKAPASNQYVRFTKRCSRREGRSNGLRSRKHCRRGRRTMFAESRGKGSERRPRFGI